MSIQGAGSAAARCISARRNRLPLCFHAEIRRGKKAGMFGGFAGRTDHIFRNFPDLVENVVDGATFSAFIVVDGHETRSPRSKGCNNDTVIRCTKIEKESS
jgi:hypothetical protein